jgi:hypothetical protein
MAPRKTAQDLELERIWDLKRGIGERILRTEKLELEIAYKQKRLKEMKQDLLNDAENLDKEIVDHGVHIAESVHHVRKAKDLLDRWIKEAVIARDEEIKLSSDAARQSLSEHVNANANTNPTDNDSDSKKA